MDWKDNQTEEIDGAVLVGRPVTTMLKNKPVFAGFTLHFCGRGLDLKPEDFVTGIHQQIVRKVVAQRLGHMEALF